MALSGVGWMSLLFCIPLMLMFKTRLFGVFDPLNMFLVTRVAPMLSAMVICAYKYTSNFYFIIFVISGILFLATLYLATPKENDNQGSIKSEAVILILRLGIIFFLIKVAILINATGEIPLFSKGGSDAYIRFDVENKVGSGFLLGLGSIDLILLSFSIPLLTLNISRVMAIMLLGLAMIVGMSSGKKSSLLVIFLAIYFGEYMRTIFLTNQVYFFIKVKYIVIGIMMSVAWAAWTFFQTSSIELNLHDISLIGDVLDFVMYQWAYPFILFASGALHQFFQEYQVNRSLYFFHSILSPLGFPAFKFSVGPSINTFINGEISGNGINPTFIIEGYVLAGGLLPVYAMLVGLIIGKCRAYILRIKCVEYRVVFSALFIPILYTLAVDGLLYIKMVYVLLMITIIILLPAIYLFNNQNELHD